MESAYNLLYSFDLASVARMRAAISRDADPAFRFAHAGYCAEGRLTFDDYAPSWPGLVPAMSRISGGSLPGGVSWPASQSSTLFALLADSLWAITEPAEPPPTMIVSYTWAVPFG